MTLPELERGALSLAHLAAIETSGTQAERTEMAIRAYLWAVDNVRPASFGDGTLTVYPSLNELREAMGRKAS